MKPFQHIGRKTEPGPKKLVYAVKYGMCYVTTPP